MTQTKQNEIFYNRSGVAVIRSDNKEVKQRKSAYGVFIQKDKILVVKPTWGDILESPGGKIELGESVEKGLIREFAEETGLEILDFIHKPILEVDQNFYLESSDEYFYSKMFFYFIIDAKENNNITIDKEEVENTQWVDIRSLNINNFRDFNLEAVKLAQKI